MFKKLNSKILIFLNGIMFSTHKKKVSTHKKKLEKNAMIKTHKNRLKAKIFQI